MARLSADRRRAQLLEATVAVMIDRGLEAATTRDVAARLGIGRGLIHHYFSSWKDLQLAAFTGLAAIAQEEATEKLAGLESPQRLGLLMDLLLADPCDPHWRLFADAWDAAQRDPELAAASLDIVGWWRAELQATLAAGAASGQFRCPDPAAAAWRLMALADGLSGYVLLAGSGLPRTEALAMLVGAAGREADRSTD